MSAVVEVAWIGVAGVAVGSFLSFLGTTLNGRITHRAAEAAIEGERRQRLWDKQSAAYEETVREVLARQIRREALTSRGDVGNIGRHPIEEGRKHEEPENIRIKALMLAYASPAVWTAYENADKANALFWRNLFDLASAQLITQMQAEQQSTDEEESSRPLEVNYQGVLDAVSMAKEGAVATDQALFDAINRELSWAPQPKVADLPS